jgi:hypothetical protein
VRPQQGTNAQLTWQVNTLNCNQFNPPGGKNKIDSPWTISPLPLPLSLRLQSGTDCGFINPNCLAL